MRTIISTTLLCLVLLFQHIPDCEAKASRLPLRVQMLFVKVSPLLEKGEYEKAIKALTSFREKRRNDADKIYNHPEMNYVLGNSYAMVQNFEKARESYLRVIDRDSNHKGAWQNLAKTEYDLEMYPQASASFMKGYELSWESKEPEPQYLYYSAVTMLMAEQYVDSLEKFDLLLQRHPETVTLKWKENLVYALLHADKPRRALPHMVELTEGFTGKKQQQWQELLLQQYMSLDMYKKALQLVQGLTRKSPTAALWWKGLAHVHLQLGTYKKALAALTVYSYLTPMTSEEHKLLADLYLQEGIPKKAIDNYQHCTLGKNDKHSALCLIRAYRSVDQLDLALEQLKKFSDILESQPYEMERGEILYSMKRYDEAAEAYLSATEHKGKESGRSFLMAGYSYWQLEKYNEAISAFTSAAEVKRFKKEAKNAMIQIASISKHQAREKEVQ